MFKSTDLRWLETYPVPIAPLLLPWRNDDCFSKRLFSYDHSRGVSVLIHWNTHWNSQPIRPNDADPRWCWASSSCQISRWCWTSLISRIALMSRLVDVVSYRIQSGLPNINVMSPRLWLVHCCLHLSLLSALWLGDSFFLDFVPVAVLLCPWMGTIGPGSSSMTSSLS